MKFVCELSAAFCTAISGENSISCMRSNVYVVAVETVYKELFVEWKDTMDVKGSSWNHRCQKEPLLLRMCRFPALFFFSKICAHSFCSDHCLKI